MNDSVYRFADWLVEPDLNRVSKAGVAHQVEPLTMDVLACLLASPGETVSPDALLNQIWGDRHGDPGMIQKRIAQLRRILGDEAKHSVYIETIRKRGYRTIAPVSRVAASKTPDAAMVEELMARTPPFPAYDGEQPYVFVCYSHDDDAAVFSELAKLNEAGANVWWDEGISPGSEWNDDIARAIDGCAQFIFYVSAASVTSMYCRNEVQYAISLGKPILSVYLAPTELTAGLKLSIGAKQALLKYEMPEEDYRRKILAYVEGTREVEHPVPGLPAARKTAYRNLAIACLTLALVVSFAWIFVEHWKSPSSMASDPAAATTPSLVHKQVSFSGHATWGEISPDGQFVAYGDMLTKQITIHDLLTAQEIIADPAPCQVIMGWSPDSAQFLAGCGEFHSRRIYAISRTGKVLWQQEVQTWGTVYFAGGDHVAVSVKEEQGITLHLHNLDTDERWKIDLVTSIPAQEASRVLYYQGRFILVTTDVSRNLFTIWSVNADGTDLVKIHESPGRHLYGLAASQGGEVVYFLHSNDDATMISSIGTEPDSKPRILMTGEFGDVHAAEDGKLTLMKSTREANIWTSVRGKAGTFELEQFTHGTAEHEFLSLSPDGSQFAFSVTPLRAGRSNIFIMSVTGGTPKQLTFFESSRNRQPVWSPDGETIAFVSDEGDRNRIWLVNADGSGLKPIVESERYTRVDWAPHQGILFKSTSGNYRIFDPDDSSDAALFDVSEIIYGNRVVSLNEEISSPLLSYGYVDRFAPKLSADASKAMVLTEKDLWVIKRSQPRPEVIMTHPRTIGWPVRWLEQEGSLYTVFGCCVFRYDFRDKSTQAVWRRGPGYGRIIGAAITDDGQRLAATVGQIRTDVWVIEDANRAQ